MKRTHLLITGIAVLVCSCNTNDSNQPDPLQVQLDSISNARISAKENELARKNDSILQALEIKKADSIERATQKDDSLKRIRNGANRPASKTDSAGR